MGLFGSRRQPQSFDRTASQVRESLQPVINDIGSLQGEIQTILEYIDRLRGFTSNTVDLSNQALVKDIIRLCTEALAKTYEIESVITEMADDLMIQMASQQVSPASVNASMKSFQVFDEGLRECKSHLKLALLDLGVTTTQAKQIVKSSWATAKANKPIGILKIEKLRDGKEEWDWITDETWRDTQSD